MKNKPYLISVPLFQDDRGGVYCPVDNIGSSDQKDIKRTYVVHNWAPNFIRAWHGHLEGWTGIHVLHGAAKIIAVGIEERKAAKQWQEHPDYHSVVLSDSNPGVYWIPPGYFNGTMSLVADTKMLVYSTLSFEEVKIDDVRAELSHYEEQQVFRVKYR